MALFFLVVGVSAFALCIAFGGVYYLNKTADLGDR